LLDQPANLDLSSRSATAPAIRPRQACPEPAKALPLPPHHRVGLNVAQWAAPAAPNSGQANPEQSIEDCQERSASLSLERGELHPESGILEGNGLVAAQQESNESNEAQQKGWHLRRLLVSIAFKVKLLWADAIMAKHM
jgi:hypothetical protein